MAPQFNAQIMHWATLSDFESYLGRIPKPAWVKGITDHNTYIPNELQWRGMTSMMGMRTTYIGKGWTAGPHLYLAAECVNPADAGIWQMTPLTDKGVHAGACNATRTGIENVGDFNARRPTPKQWQLAVSVNAALCRAWKLDASAINVHSDCMEGRTCPGQYFDGAQLRADVAAALATTAHLGEYIISGLPIYNDSQLTVPSGRRLTFGQKITIDRTHAEQPADYAVGAAHVSDAQGGGFIDLNGAVKL